MLGAPGDADGIVVEGDDDVISGRGEFVQMWEKDFFDATREDVSCMCEWFFKASADYGVDDKPDLKEMFARLQSGEVAIGDFLQWAGDFALRALPLLGVDGNYYQKEMVEIFFYQDVLRRLVFFQLQQILFVTSRAELSDRLKIIDATLKSKHFKKCLDFSYYNQAEVHFIAISLAHLVRRVFVDPGTISRGIRSLFENIINNHRVSEMGAFSEIAFRHDFPQVELGDSSELAEFLDPNKPTILCAGSSDDQMAFARALFNSGKVNVVLSSCSDNVGLDPARGKNLLIKKGAVYAGDSIRYGNFSGKVYVDYIWGSFYDDDQELRELVRACEVPSRGIPGMRHMTSKIAGKIALASAGASTAKSRIFVPLGDRGRLESFFSEINSNKVVVKPDDLSGGHGVRIFEDFAAATAYVYSLLDKNCSVLVEEFLESMPLVVDGERQDWNLRVFLTNDDEDKAVPAGIVVRYDSQAPVNFSQLAKPMTFENLLESLDLSEGQKVSLEQDILDLARKVGDHFMEFAKRYPGYKKGNSQDLMGIDVIVVMENGTPKPYILEMNGANSGGMWNLDSVLPEEQQGVAIKPMVKRVIYRAEMHFAERWRASLG